jgi:hypothetical protein
MSTVLIGTHASEKFITDSLAIGYLCTADDRIFSIIHSKPSIPPLLRVVALSSDYFSEPLLNKNDNSKLGQQV